MSAMGPSIRIWDADTVTATIGTITLVFSFTNNYTKTVVSGGDTTVTQVAFSGSITQAITYVPVDYTATTAPYVDNTFAIVRINDSFGIIDTQPNIVSRVVQELTTDGAYDNEPVCQKTDTFTVTTTTTFNSDPPSTATNSADVTARTTLSLDNFRRWRNIALISGDSFATTSGGVFYTASSVTQDTTDTVAVDLSTLSGITGCNETLTYPIPNNTSDTTWSGWTVNYNWTVSLT